jgi:hypothetical protein
VDFTLKTTGGSAGGPRFTGYRRLPNGNLQLTLQGTVGQMFLIERASSVLGPWVTVTMRTIPAGGMDTFEAVAGSPPSFFRARTP